MFFKGMFSVPGDKPIVTMSCGRAQWWVKVEKKGARRFTVNHKQELRAAVRKQQAGFRA